MLVLRGYHTKKGLLLITQTGYQIMIGTVLNNDYYFQAFIEIINLFVGQGLQTEMTYLQAVLKAIMTIVTVPGRK